MSNTDINIPFQPHAIDSHQKSHLRSHRHEGHLPLRSSTVRNRTSRPRPQKSSLSQSAATANHRKNERYPLQSRPLASHRLRARRREHTQQLLLLLRIRASDYR